MHAWALPFLLIRSPRAVMDWTLATPWWLWTSATVTQGLCSWAIVHINNDARLGAVGGQVAQVLRRAICVAIVTAMHDQVVSARQWCGLACALLSATLFTRAGPRVKPKVT